MFGRILVTVACLCVFVGSVAGDPSITELYPDPATDGDDGEFVTLDVPAESDITDYTLTDGEDTVSLANLSDRPPPEFDGELTLSTNATLTRQLTNRTVVEMPGYIRLTDRGDSIFILHNGTVVDSARYERARNAQVYDTETDSWRPLGATDFEPVDATGGVVEPFVVPDSPDRAVSLLEDASERIFLAGYTLSSEQVVDTLVRADERGVDVEVLVDGRPVGGMDASAAAALDRLDREGIPVSVIGGDRDRYRWHHAKYAVVDDRALVTTENWSPAGTGGLSSRGWGVVTDQPAIVDGLVETFSADTGWVDAIPWSEFDDVTLVDGDRAHGGYPTKFEPETATVDRTRLLLAPDNAHEEIHSTIRNAEESIDIKQVQIGDADFPFLQAVIDAAERGVEVRILLSSAWYAESENRELKRWITEQAEAADLPIETRLADPDGDFEKIHAKGMIVDGERTLVGSINWNNNSVGHNREVALLIDGTEPAAYFESVFEADWEQDGRELPLGLIAVSLVCALLAVVVAIRQIRWDPVERV